MPQDPGVQVIAALVPQGLGVSPGLGLFPTHRDVHTYGGFQVRTDNADRDDIPNPNRKEGMLVYVTDTNITYRLGAGLTNSDWMIVTAGGINTFALITDMAAQSISGMTDGTFAYVQSIKSFFFLDTTSALLADNITIVPAAGGTGQWLRTPDAHPFWLTQTEWFVSTATGDDQNDGSSGNPIATHTELSRRWGQEGHISVDVTVTIMDSLDPTDPIRLNIILDGSIYYTGVVSTVRTGTATTVTPRNAATNQKYTILDSGLPAANSWTANVNQRVRMTNGPASGAYAWVIADLGTRTASLSEFASTSPFTIAVDLLTPANGNTYIVEAMPSVTMQSGDINVGGGGFFVVENLDITNGEMKYTSITTFLSCIFQSPLAINNPSGIQYILNCLCLATAGSAFGFLELDAGLVRPLSGAAGGACVTSVFGSKVVLDAYVILEEGGLVVDPSSQGLVGLAGIFNVIVGGINPTGDGVLIGNAGGTVAGPGGSIVVKDWQYGSGALFGNGNFGAGVSVGVGGTFVTDVTPTITGGDGDFIMNGNHSGYAFTTVTNSFAGPFTTTWANLANSSVFNGSAINPFAGCRVIRTPSGSITGTYTVGNSYQIQAGPVAAFGPLNLAGGSNYVTGTLPAGNIPSGTGDWTGAITSNTVVKINTASVPAAGALTTGNVLQVNGISSLTYGPVNLAGGTNYVTGVLPTGNQANQTLFGDVSGTTNSNVVAHVTGAAGGVDFFGAPGYGGGDDVISIHNCATAPTTNPSNGNITYVEGGILKCRGSSGTITFLGPA